MHTYSCISQYTQHYLIIITTIITCSSGGGTSLFRMLSMIGAYRNLDYLSRLSLMSLAFTDGGFMSRHLVQLWASPAVKGNTATTSGRSEAMGSCRTSCSADLLQFMHVVMRALFRSRSEAFLQVTLTDIPSPHTLSAHPVNTHSQLAFSTYPIKTPCVSMHCHCQYALLIPFLLVFFQSLLSQSLSHHLLSFRTVILVGGGCHALATQYPRRRHGTERKRIGTSGPPGQGRHIYLLRKNIRGYVCGAIQRKRSKYVVFVVVVGVNNRSDPRSYVFT